MATAAKSSVGESTRAAMVLVLVLLLVEAVAWEYSRITSSRVPQQQLAAADWSGGGGEAGFAPGGSQGSVLHQQEWFTALVVRSEGLRQRLPFFMRTSLRNLACILALYVSVSTLAFSYGSRASSSRSRTGMGRFLPTSASMWKQVGESSRAGVIIALVAACAECGVARGWSRCYASIADVGAFHWACNSLAYLLVADLGVYALHWILHVSKPLYHGVHQHHHAHDHPDNFSPFAGFALHPIEAILQPSIFGIVLFVVPTHYLTFLAINSCIAVWVVCNHSRLPIMVESSLCLAGPKYHGVHHSKQDGNYGVILRFWDVIFGTYIGP